MKEELLRRLPQVDSVLRLPALARAISTYGRNSVAKAVRAEIDAVRTKICAGEFTALRGGVSGDSGTLLPGAGTLLPDTGTFLPDTKAHLLDTEVLLPNSKTLLLDTIVQCTMLRLSRGHHPVLRRVINATGVILHTNLGRAPLCKQAIQAVGEAACGYSNLEYDLDKGSRGSRNTLVEPLLCALCGCEGALVVNNNAAALLLALAAFARGKTVPVSRGELVEVGDGFRIPDIMAQSGAQLLEVGATNKTHLADYVKALRDHETGLLLKVHTSNYKVIGFTASVSVKALAALAHEHGLPLLVDLGSGALLPDKAYPFSGEPGVLQTLRDGADLICFSGDKLLGGPQAGILLGKRPLIEAMRKHPLARALRIDKLSLAALEATLCLYQNEQAAKRNIPVLRMFSETREIRHARVLALEKLLRQNGVEQHCEISVVDTQIPAGGGTAPIQFFDSVAVALVPRYGSAGMLEQALRRADSPVIARICDGRLLLDAATMTDEDCLEAAKAVQSCFAKEEKREACDIGDSRAR